ncbi:RNA 3'-terminal phosphate cyclase [Haloarchaeobius sp. DYHT-AS-18]|uniref:RNA 3'-terminal phosphate cyclase n=1 Tax=Haloarchaeobius sp. DYHT-AS-18 TaxID=3446117 RepID=UPI003EB69BC1
MKEVDGQDGGGQILRSALTLSALTGDPVTIENIRGSRPTPGLKPQHLTGVEAIAAICDATIEGASEGSEKLVFEPKRPRPGHYEVSVGTAGSVTLVFETLLPLATAIDGHLSVTVSGGTDVKWSPSMAYYQHVKLPTMRRFGLLAAVEETRPGFYPRGGGEATLHLAPSSLDPIHRRERGDLQGVRVYSTESADLSNADVAARQATAAVPDFGEESDVPLTERVVRTADSPSTGTAVCVRLDYEQTMVGFDALGEPGTPAEEVGKAAADAATDFHASSAAVDEFLADQLVLPLALAGGEVHIPGVTEHVETNCGVMAAFDREVSVELADTGAILSG